MPRPKRGLNFLMKKQFKKYFIPHSGNKYQPHFLHVKRCWFYAALGIVIKSILLIFVLFLPAQAFLMPDILAVEQSKIIMLTNEFRASENAGKLMENPKLSASAIAKAKDMADKEYFAHVNPEGLRLENFLRDVSYKYVYAGENLAIGYFDALSVVKAWKDSPSHRENMLDRDYLEIGVGIANGQYLGLPNVFATQHFGRPLEMSSVAGLKTDLNQESFIEARLAATKEIELPPVKNSTASGLHGNEFSLLYKYRAANHMLSDTMPIFGFSKMLYFSLIILFSLALLLNILVEFKIQHRHVIARSLALIGFLSCLWLI